MCKFGTAYSDAHHGSLCERFLEGFGDVNTA